MIGDDVTDQPVAASEELGPYLLTGVPDSAENRSLRPPGRFEHLMALPGDAPRRSGP